MRADLPTLTPEELVFIRAAFAGTRRGVNEFGMLEFTCDDTRRAAWGMLCHRVREWMGAHSMKCIILSWRQLLASKLKSDWYEGKPDAEIGRVLDVDGAQIARWRKFGIPLDGLLQSLYLTGHWDEPLPHHTGDFVKRLMLPVAMHMFDGFFRQAGVLNSRCPGMLPAWQVELFRQVIERASEWDAAVARAGDRSKWTGALAPLATATIASTLAALTADGHAGDDLAPVSALMNNKRRAVEECLHWRNDSDAFIALRWAVNALNDEMLLPFE